MKRPLRSPPSLRWRLLAATVVVLSVALLLAGWSLTALFREHATQQFRQGLQLQLDQLTAGVEFATAAEPAVTTLALTDPRWQKPYSGLYWQIDGKGRTGVLRSRSLWDTALPVPEDTLADGAVHAHEVTGPQGRPLLLLERSIHDVQQPDASWRLMVAASIEPVDAAVASFRGQLTLSLLILLALLALASWVQVTVGLAPLRALRRALEAVHHNRAGRLEGRFPQEVQPLVDDFNSVLEQNASVVERARKHAGNLAHAVKTPLSVLRQVAEQLAGSQRADGAAQDPRVLGRLMMEQIELARRHVDWHLARSRSAAGLRSWGQTTRVEPTVQGLVRVMQRVYANRGLRLEAAPIPEGLCFLGEEQDLQEMLGNLLDNACKWARSCVTIRAQAAGEPTGQPARLRIQVDDDGPGIAAQDLDSVAARGVRLDETVPGTGLGLAIVQDLVELYGGTLELRQSAAGGLSATLTLPAAAC